MTASLSRRVRRFGLALVPPPQRARLRRWYEASAAPAVGTTAAFTTTADAVDVAIEGGPVFRILPETQADIACHFATAEHAAELAAFLREARRPGLLFDVGANNGLFSVLFCLAHPGNRAVSYEPSACFADRASRMAMMNGLADRMVVLPRALGERRGRTELLLDDRQGFVQAVPFDGTAHAAWRSASFDVTTLDAEAEANGPPTLVKIDVEGYEREVLQGATTLLERHRPVVCLELHLNYLEQRGIAAADAVRPLVDRAYVLQDLAGRAVTGSRIARSWASVLHLVAHPEEHA